MITTNQLQHRETLRARLKFDAPGRYALNFGAFSGSRFTSGWNNTGIGLGDWQKTLSVRALYFAAQPIAGVEGQYGSMYIIKGESTEITTYDEDGYVIGERVSVRRPRHLFFDEMSATVGYFTSTPAEIGVSKRVKYLDDRPNYGHFLVDKKTGHARRRLRRFHVGRRRAHVARGGERQHERAARGGLDCSSRTTSARTETRRTASRVSANKALSRGNQRSTGATPASIRSTAASTPTAFTSATACSSRLTYVISPRFTASAFITRAVGNDVALPQRTLSNLIFTYNALPDLRRTGLF